MAPNDTLFTNEASAAADTTSYVKDVFQDVTLQATSNSGYTDTAARNPFGLSFGNDDVVRYGAKKLFIKDLRPIRDTSKWINNQPTYQIVFDQDTVEVMGYVYGSFFLLRNEGQPYLLFKNTSSGCGITGIVRRVGILSNGDSSTTTIQVAVDGSNTTTVSVGGLNLGTADLPNVGDFPQSKLIEQLHAASNETKDIHDIRFIPTSTNNFTFIGFEIYHENSGANIDVFPGTTYVNKTKVTTTIGATFSLPSFGSSLGGNALVYKASSNGYQLDALSATTLISQASGSINTNLVTVTTGQGASFKAGYGIVIPQGTSHYVGSILSVSTDTLTVSPTLPFAISNIIYASWKAGPTYAIGSTQYALLHTIDFNKSLHGLDATAAFLDAQGRYTWYAQNATYMSIDSTSGTANQLEIQTAFSFAGASGFIAIQGNFQAADIVWGGTGTLSASYMINGTPGFGDSRSITTFYENTIFKDAGNGWNSIVITPGSSHATSVGIKQINLYGRTFNQGITYGRLGSFEVLQAQTFRSAYNASMIALGVYRRVFADQLYLSGNWTRGTTSVPGNVVMFGQSTNAAINFTYYGKDFALIGTGASGNLTVDGASTANTYNAIKTVSSEGWHTVAYAHLGGTVAISAIDYFRTASQVKALNNVNNINQLDLDPAIFGRGYKMSQFVRRGGVSDLVTSKYLRLGAWVCGIRQANGYNYTFSALPTTNPSAVGYVIYDGSGWTGNDTANKPTMYAVFVGKNKKLRIVGSADGSYFDLVDAEVRDINTAQSSGLKMVYNKASGLLYIIEHVDPTKTGATFPGWQWLAGSVSTMFFDIIVEDDDAQKGVVD